VNWIYLDSHCIDDDVANNQLELIDNLCIRYTGIVDMMRSPMTSSVDDELNLHCTCIQF
jgi:hypothetical protein